MKKIAEYELKVSPTKDKKKTQKGITEYEYGCINVRDTALLPYVGKKVKIKIEETKN